MLLGYSFNRNCGTTLLIFTAVNLLIMLSLSRCIFCEKDDDKLQNFYYFDSFFYSLMANSNNNKVSYVETASAYAISPYLTNSTDISSTCKHASEMKIKPGPDTPKGQCSITCNSNTLYNISATPFKCLRYLDNNNKEIDVCDMVPTKQLLKMRLKYCCEFSVKDTIYSDNLLTDYSKCKDHILFLRNLEEFVGEVTCQNEENLYRYDCQKKYSVNECHNCKEAYRRWVCSSLITHWRERHKVKPCRSICQTVQKNCPWFLPGDKNPGVAAQYAGEPAFACIDSNIEEAGEQVLHSSYGSKGDDCCYEYCHGQTKFHPILTTCIVPTVKGNKDKCWKYRKSAVNSKVNNLVLSSSPSSLLVLSLQNNQPATKLILMTIVLIVNSLLIASFSTCSL